MYEIYNEGNGPFILINDKKLFINENEKRKILLGYSYVNGEFIINNELIIKENLIKNYKRIKDKANKLRTDFLTYELDDSELSQIIKQKLQNEGDLLKIELKQSIEELVNMFGEDILNELI